MLFLLFGSSAAGKTTTVAALRGRVPGLAAHDFDEIGVPARPTVAWRYAANEAWLERAIARDTDAVDVLVAAQTPLGEMLAAPSAPRVRVGARLLDCSDEVRIARLEARGPAWLARAGGTLGDYIAWGRWMRGHARDPLHRVEAIRRDGSQHWERLPAVSADPRRPIPTISSEQTVEDVASAVERWVRAERETRTG